MEDKEVVSSDSLEVVAYRYTGSARAGGKWHYQESFPKWDDRKVREIGQMDELITVAQHKRIIADLKTQPSGVVLPERMAWDGLRATACNIRGEGWNACLDEVARLNQHASAGDERAAFEVCGVTVKRNEVGDWEYLSEGYGNDPDIWVACSDILGRFGGGGVDELLTAYAELQARAALSANHSEQVRALASDVVPVPRELDLLQVVREKRISVEPEYEGQWHANMYGEEAAPICSAEGDTPEAAIRALLNGGRS